MSSFNDTSLWIFHTGTLQRWKACDRIDAHVLRQRARFFYDVHSDAVEPLYGFMDFPLHHQYFKSSGSNIIVGSNGFAGEQPANWHTPLELHSC